MKTVQLNDETCRLIEKANELCSLSNELRESYMRTPQYVVHAAVAKSQVRSMSHTRDHHEKFRVTLDLLEETPEWKRFIEVHREAGRAIAALSETLRLLVGAPKEAVP
jgi:hypothetical protein